MTEKQAMFWLLRRLFSLAVLVALVWVILQLDYQGRPVKDRVSEVIHSPLVQEVTRQVKGAVLGYLKKDLKESPPAMEKLDEKDRADLEKVLKEQAGRKPAP